MHKLLLKILYWLMSTSGILLFHQSDYKGEFGRLVLSRSNNHYVGNPKVFTYKYNRTTPATNATWTWIENLGSDIQVVAQAYTFLSNEYRLFPLRFQFNFCDCLIKNEFGMGRFLTCGNFTKCPLRKGRYHICNWTPDESRFPPHIPDGKYMIQLTVQVKEVELMVFDLYGRVYRPIPITN